MRTHPRTAIAAAFVVASLALGAPAHAAEPAPIETAASTTDPESVFHEFVADLDLPSAKMQQIEDYFASLPEKAQEAGAADPSSLFTVSEVSSTVTPLPTAAPGRGRVTAPTAAGTRTLQVNNRQDVRIGTVSLIIFTLTYTYEARGSAVVRNLGCTGSATGVISASSTSSSWISQGRGTCEVRTQASVFIKGLPFQFTKVHTVTTQAGNPARVDGRIYTV